MSESKRTSILLDFNEGPGKEGTATIYYKDNEAFGVDYYVWSLEDEYLVQRIEEELGYKIKLYDYSGGNGHHSAKIKRI
jgi:hypothetical protein